MKSLCMTFHVSVDTTNKTKTQSFHNCFLSCGTFLLLCVTHILLRDHFSTVCLADLDPGWPFWGQVLACCSKQCTCVPLKTLYQTSQCRRPYTFCWFQTRPVTQAWLSWEPMGPQSQRKLVTQPLVRVAPSTGARSWPFSSGCLPCCTPGMVS